MIDRIRALATIGWTFIAYNIVVSNAMGYVCWLRRLHRLPASVASITTMVVPVGGGLVAAAWLHEPLGAYSDRGADLRGRQRREAVRS